jgi:hypothetical protein
MVCSDLLEIERLTVSAALVRVLAASGGEQRAVRHELDAADVRLRDATCMRLRDVATGRLRAARTAVRPVMSALVITV